jgi:hypothetical protein
MASEDLQGSASTPERAPALTPITDLHDPRAIQILTTEHYSVLGARSLAYDEAFVRAGMFLSFLSMSFVGLALLADAMGFGQQFLAVAAIVLGFDLIVGLTTFERIAGANLDDLRALQGMARIRHGYLRVAPLLRPYISTATHDDMDSVTREYNAPDGYGVSTIVYGLSTSLGMIGLVLSMLAGVEGGVIGMIAGLELIAAVMVAVVAAVVVFVLLFVMTGLRVTRSQARLEARFPVAAAATPVEPEETIAGE